MFKRSGEQRPQVSITVDGKALAARAGDTVAAALLAAGIAHCRTTPVSETPRAPYCLMGVCFDCLAEIDGRPNRQSCMVTVAPGMTINRQRGKRAALAGEGKSPPVT